MRLPLLLFVLLVAACGEMPQPFRHDGPNPMAVPPGPRAVLVRPPGEGTAAGTMASVLVTRLMEHDIPASSRSAPPGSWILAAQVADQGAWRHLHWRLTGPEGEQPLHFSQTLPSGQWEGAGPSTIARLADELLAKALPLLQAGLSDAAGPPPVVVVRVEPLGSLPGDGNTALAKAMGNALQRLGLRLGGQEAEFVVRGQAMVLPGPAGTESLDLTWKVMDARTGQELGQAAQQGSLPKGRMAGPWGGLAADIAQGGADGIAEIIAAIGAK